MKYALVKFKVHLLGSKPFVIYIPIIRHYALRPSLLISLREWIVVSPSLPNIEVKDKPGKQNALADALPRRPYYELAHVTILSSSVTDLIRTAYAKDEHCVALLRALGSKGCKTTQT